MVPASVVATAAVTTAAVTTEATAEESATAVAAPPTQQTGQAGRSDPAKRDLAERTA